jgi:hypothetical protein
MRFLVRWQLGLLLVVAAGLGLLFGLSSYAGLASRVFTPSAGPYFGPRRDLLAVALTPARYHEQQPQLPPNKKTHGQGSDCSVRLRKVASQKKTKRRSYGAT